jgi:peptidoglycan/xylan/chitin deacetylase (PgdA/CDA1 family)/NADP-dependent 3-hydroxy acid dehydrogenase YdfG
VDRPRPANAQRPILMSQGAYGWKVGMPRILALLARYGISATFFIPGEVADKHPDLVREVVDKGHEVAHHSYSHRWIVNLSPAEERDEMDRGMEALTRLAGTRPRGWRSPAAEFSSITLDLLKEYGFDYSSNFFDDDSPYLLEIGGQRTDIVELPFRWVLDDAPFFQYSITLPGRTLQAPSAALEAWTSEFDMLYAEDRMMMVGMHPQIIGQPSRLKVLEGLIEHALATPTCGSTAATASPTTCARAEGGARRHGGMTTAPSAALRFVVSGGASGIGFAVARLGGGARRARRAARPRREARLQYSAACAGRRGAAAGVRRHRRSGREGCGEPRRRVARRPRRAGQRRGHRFAQAARANRRRRMDPHAGRQPHGPMLMCRAAMPHLRAAGGGSIVNISSGAGLRPLPNRTAYCATKAAVIMFGKALSIEAAADGIRVNAVCPGAIDTPLFRTSYDTATTRSARWARFASATRWAASPRPKRWPRPCST